MAGLVDLLIVQCRHGAVHCQTRQRLPRVAAAGCHRLQLLVAAAAAAALGAARPHRGRVSKTISTFSPHGSARHMFRCAGRRLTFGWWVGVFVVTGLEGA